MNLDRVNSGRDVPGDFNVIIESFAFENGLELKKPKDALNGDG